MGQEIKTDRVEMQLKVMGKHRHRRPERQREVSSGQGAPSLALLDERGAPAGRGRGAAGPGVGQSRLPQSHLSHNEYANNSYPMKPVLCFNTFES